MSKRVKKDFTCCHCYGLLDPWWFFSSTPLDKIVKVGFTVRLQRLLGTPPVQGLVNYRRWDRGVHLFTLVPGDLGLSKHRLKWAASHLPSPEHLSCYHPAQRLAGAHREWSLGQSQGAGPAEALGRGHKNFSLAIEQVTGHRPRTALRSGLPDPRQVSSSPLRVLPGPHFTLPLTHGVH